MPLMPKMGKKSKWFFHSSADVDGETHIHLSSYIMVFIFLSISLLLLPCTTQAQPRTDPAEALALNTIFDRWKISPPPNSWNVTGDPCSGAAIDTTQFDNSFNPFIKCDCSEANGTVCHVTQIKIYSLDVTGPIPQELLSFPSLFNLDMRKNLLTGSMPAFLGNLTNMLYIAFGANNFSGSLPPEIGNLINLQQLYIDSFGVSGEIPSTFANLQNLLIMWASGNTFTGRIPDFIGNFTGHTDLRLQGNSFQGPIPSSLAKLTKLSKLRIGDLTNDSSSLSFIQNMTGLSTLVLRNCKISDTIPLNIGNYTELILLDLSFNNLIGRLPQSLFNLNILNFLFLGNNNLTGGLPTQKAPNLVNVDLSYNNLLGSFPSWVSQNNLNLNLVANNFTISKNSPPGLDCLQKNFPCNRGSPIWSSFAINCGGSTSITSSDGILFDNEDEKLNAASYYVSGRKRWAVSNVGRFGDSANATYIVYSSSQFTNTLDSGLFQTSRITPSSLRYYGLGLENGNYTVKLQFAESLFENRPTWNSVGKRIFDIYIQGKLVVKDFDIRKQTGGTSQRATDKSYFANVTENFLEIHFFWAGKGTCCIPTSGTYGPLISAISVTPNFIPSVTNHLPSFKKNMDLIVGLVVGIVALCALLLLGGLFKWRQNRLRLKMMDDGELLGLVKKADIFSFAELQAGTGDFNSDNKLGQGGYGAVYKGKLSDGREIAVKQLSVTSHQGKRQFVAEIKTISAVRHRNLVKLYGCCIEGAKPLLVYEYLENNSLSHALFGNSDLVLDWPSRCGICLGTARGLAYLHEDSSVKIVHRDVKSSNILLDADFNPKISDFGLAKLFNDRNTHISTNIAGTIGYLAPEYALRGYLTEKADVFGFGVVVLEILTGRLNTDPSLGVEKMYLLAWAWDLYDSNNGLEMMDPKLSSYDEEEAIRIIRVALLCTQTSPSLRPPMSKVVNMLAGEIEVPEVISKPSYLTEWAFGDSSSYHM